MNGRGGITDHARWFLGKGDLKNGTGYGLGHRLLAEHLSQAAGEDAVTLAQAPADMFRPAMRRLAGADGVAEGTADGAADDEDGGEG